MEVPDEGELLEGTSKNATRSRSSDVGGRVIVEAARAGVLGLSWMLVATFVRKRPRNRKTGWAVLDNAFFVTLASINNPCVSGQRKSFVERQQERS